MLDNAGFILAIATIIYGFLIAKGIEQDKNRIYFSLLIFAIFAIIGMVI